MALFDWFRPTQSSVQTLDDTIWLTKDAKLAGMGRLVEENEAGRAPPRITLLVAQFRECLGELQEVAAAREFDRLRVVPLLAADLEAFGSSVSSLGEDSRIDLVVGERHPLRPHDDAIVEIARRFPCRCRLGYHLSLDDPLMRAFSGDWIQGLLKRLGMSENEPLQSPIIGRQIEKSQQEIAQKATSDRETASAEEWMLLNRPR